MFALFLPGVSRPGQGHLRENCRSDRPASTNRSSLEPSPRTLAAPAILRTMRQCATKCLKASVSTNSLLTLKAPKEFNPDTIVATKSKICVRAAEQILFVIIDKFMDRPLSLPVAFTCPVMPTGVQFTGRLQTAKWSEGISAPCCFRRLRASTFLNLSALLVCMSCKIGKIRAAWANDDRIGALCIASYTFLCGASQSAVC